MAGPLPAPIDPVRRAVDLVNALAGPPGRVLDPDRDRALLTEVLLAHGEHDVDLGPGDVADLRAAVAALTRILDADDPATAAPLINQALVDCGATPRLSDHDGSPWHLHVARPGAGWGDSMLAGSALALGVLLADRGGCPWGRCAAPGCDRYYVHDGRGSPRRFCSARCATRTRVAAHRRQRGS